MIVTDDEIARTTQPALLPSARGQHKRRQLAQSLRTMASKMHARDRFPSVSELEKHFRVSTTTVEAALGELKAEGLIVRRRGSGTFVADVTGIADGTVHARARRTGQLVITSIGSSRGVVNIFSAMAWALEAEMRRMGFDPIILFDNDAQTRLDLAQKRWEAGSVDGYVHIGSLGPGLTFPPAPGVVIGELPDGAAPPRIHQVVVDNFAGGRRAGEYLWDLGHRRIAFVTPEDMLSGGPRLAGLVRAVEERGGSPEEAVAYAQIPPGGEHTYAVRIEAALHDLFQREHVRNTPTAIFFANDNVAFPALQILLSWGVRIPQDVSVLSFDDTPGLASHTRPAMTSLRMPTLDLGALAVQALADSVQNPSTPFRRLRLPAELIVRESTGPPHPTNRAGNVSPPPFPLEENP